MATPSDTKEPPWNGSLSDAVDPNPHVEWLRSFRYIASKESQSQPWIPILIELRAKGLTAAELARYEWIGEGLDPSAVQKWIRVPAMYANPPWRMKDNRYCTAIVTPEYFDRVNDFARLKDAIEQIEIGMPHSVPDVSSTVESASLPIPRRCTSSAASSMTATLALDRFQRSNGSSRIAFYWDQDGSGGVPDVGYGRETDDSAIDAAAATARDEDELYRDLEFLNFSETGFKAIARRVSHGSAALDIAYGRTREYVAASKRLPIIAVKTPNRITENPADFDLEPWIIDALYYILLRADEIARKDKCGALPVAVNLSYGVMHGPHDGTSILERVIDHWIGLRAGKPKLAVVLPTGNWHLDRIHARIDVPENDTVQTIALRVPPDNSASSWTYLYIRLHDPSDKPVVSVRVTDPAENATTWVTTGQKVGIVIGGILVCELIYPVVLSGHRDMIALWIAPTTRFDNALPVARSGRWTIEVRNAGDAFVVDGWVRRGESPLGHPRKGRQARFEHDAYEIVDDTGRRVEIDNASYIKRVGTASGMTTGDETIVVGGARRRVQGDAPSKFRAARYSGAGPFTATVEVPTPTSRRSPTMPRRCTAYWRAGPAVAAQCGSAEQAQQRPWWRAPCGGKCLQARPSRDPTFAILRV